MGVRTHFGQGLTYLTPAATGGILCLGLYLHQFFAGTEIGLPYVSGVHFFFSCLTNCNRGFQTTSRANPLAQKIVKAEIAQGLNSSITDYSPDNCELCHP
jgi:hypothetical protein